MLSWLIAHEELVLAVLLGVSELLALLFPASSGFGGIVAGMVKVLKKLGAKKPEAV